MITKLQADALVEKHKHFYRKDLKINNVDVYLYNYILQDTEVFVNEPLSRELRGLVITKENAQERVFLSCPKFFNINELPETQYSVVKLKKVKKISEKLDGSLITPIEIGGEIFMKSKASFESPQAKQAQEILDTSADLKFFILDIL